MTSPARFTVTLSPDLHTDLAGLEKDDGVSRETVLRKALHLYLVARDGERKGLTLGLTDAPDHLTTRIVGLGPAGHG